MTFPTLGEDKVAWEVAGDALGSKPETSHCVGASGLINLRAIGQGYREQEAQTGGKDRRRMELVT